MDKITAQKSDNEGFYTVFLPVVYKNDETGEEIKSKKKDVYSKEGLGTLISEKEAELTQLHEIWDAIIKTDKTK